MLRKALFSFKTKTENSIFSMKRNKLQTGLFEECWKNYKKYFKMRKFKSSVIRQRENNNKLITLSR